MLDTWGEIKTIFTACLSDTFFPHTTTTTTLSSHVALIEYFFSILSMNSYVCITFDIDAVHCDGKIHWSGKFMLYIFYFMYYYWELSHMGMNVFALIIIIFGRHLRDGKFIHFRSLEFSIWIYLSEGRYGKIINHFFLIHLMAVVYRMNLAKKTIVWHTINHNFTDAW